MPASLGAREQERLVRRALDLARTEGDGPDAPAAVDVTYEPLGLPQRTSTDLAIILLQQTHRGVPVRDAVRSAQLGSGTSDAKLTGQATPVPPDVHAIPSVGVRAAAYAAARHLADEVLAERRLEVSNRRPRLVAQSPDPRRTSVLAKAPFVDPITAGLVVLPEQAALAWNVRLELPRGGGAFAVFVEATGRRTRNPRVIAWERMTAHAANARGTVCEWDGVTAGVVRAMPRLPAEYGALVMPEPEAWVDTDSTAGNNVAAVVGGGGPVRATLDGQGELVFPAGSPPGIADAVVNAFYWCNVAHDFFCLVGFDEGARNFQSNNRSGLGSGGDAVRVTQWGGDVDGLGNFVNRTDGRQPELNLGVKDGRFAGLDVDVVLHEYAHGVVNRTVGNGAMENPFRQPQSRALSEGYCDYFAISLQNFLRPAGQQDWIVGAWIASKPTGLRASAYRPGFTATYGSLRAPGFDEDHDAGQVWCATLLDIETALVAEMGSPDGHLFAWRLVFDSLTRLHTGRNGPTFLHARTAIVEALERDLATQPANHPVGRAVLRVFAARGMGPNARSKSAGYTKIEEDVG
jgi:extracellular elastinolytic metalloproteinase